VGYVATSHWAVSCKISTAASSARGYGAVLICYPVAVLRGGANRALAPKKVCGLIGLKNCIMVTTIQLMRLFRNTMTVSKIFSSAEAKMVHIWPNLRYSPFTQTHRLHIRSLVLTSALETMTYSRRQL